MRIVVFRSKNQSELNSVENFYYCQPGKVREDDKQLYQTAAPAQCLVYFSSINAGTHIDSDISRQITDSALSHN